MRTKCFTSLLGILFCFSLPVLAAANLEEIIAESTGISVEEARFLETLNAYREQNGLEPLVLSIALTRNAEWMSQDMAAKNYMSHSDSLGRSFTERMTSFGYSLAGSYVGENVAAGNERAEQTFAQWRDSPGHNRNMLNPRFRAIGIASAYNANSRYRWYWATPFGSRVDTADILEPDTER